MFYLIGTGKAIKDAVRENGLDPALIEETKRFKNASYPSLMLAMGLVMATFILGGGVATGSVPAWVHHVLFYLAVLVQLYALRIEWRVLGENERLMADVDRRLATAASPGGPAPDDGPELPLHRPGPDPAAVARGLPPRVGPRLGGRLVRRPHGPRPRRVSLNPLRHFDLLGCWLFPALLLTFGWPLFRLGTLDSAC